MKKTATLIAALALAGSAAAQSLNIVCGEVTYVVPAAQAGDMLYNAGTTLSVMGRDFATSEITHMYVDDSRFADNTVLVDYTASGAKITVAGNIMRYLSVDNIAAAVSITDTGSESITYRLSGSSAAGSFALSASSKAIISLENLTLTSSAGAALDLQNKGAMLIIADGSTNTLRDCAAGGQKGAIVSKGALEISGTGSLEVYGNTSHAIYSKAQIAMSDATVSVLAAVKDGVNCNKSFTLNSGALTIAGVGDDGVQTSFKDELDRQPDDTGTITINGGSINCAVTATAAKGLKADGDFVALGGDITAVATNNDALDSNGNLYISGGYIRAFGGSAPECGLDANEEQGYTVIITGGTVLGVGGGNNSTPRTAESTQPYVSGSATMTAGSTVTLSSGSTVLATFTVPENYKSSGSGMGGPGGGRPGPGGSSGGAVLISCPGLTSGSSYTLKAGSSSSSLTARLSGSSGGRP